MLNNNIFRKRTAYNNGCGQMELL